MTPPSVYAFIDYQNMHLSAHEQFCDPAVDEPWSSLIHPGRLADLVVDRRAPGGRLDVVRVYRGKPNPRKQPTLAAATSKQHHAWQQDDRVTVVGRGLMYPADFGEPWCTDKAREKGIDVALAVDVVRMAIEKRFDVGIIFSRDTDLLPAVEAVADLRAAHIEVVTWEGSSQLRRNGLYCHKLSRGDFEHVRDRTDYSPPVSTGR